MIECKALSYRYSDQIILDQFSMSVSDHEFLGIIGPSGVGKSTLLRLIANLLEPQSGTLLVNQKPLIEANRKASLQERRLATASVGFIFQDLNLFPHLSVIDNLTLAYRLKTKKDGKPRAMELLASLNIEDKAEQYPDQLSGGQKQRVAIARALMLDPELLLIDEATSALDPTRKQEFLTILKELHQKGLTVVLVTHDHEVAYQWCTRVIEMK